MLKYCNKDSGRPHVPAAVRMIVERYRAGESYAAGDLAPRTGKTAIMQLAALELRELGSPFCLATAAWKILPKQAADPSTIERYIGWYCEPKPHFQYVATTIRHIRGSDFYRFETGTPHLLTCTIGLLMANKSAFLDAVQMAYEQSGLRPVIFIDEAQLLALMQPWGAFAEELVDNRAFVVVLTGTRIRRDGKEVPGFKFTPSEEWRERERRLYRKRVDESGKVRHFMQTIKSKSRAGTDTVDFHVSWQEAFINGWLNRMNIIWLDDPVDLASNGKTSSVPVKDIPAKLVRKMLREISDSDSVIEKAAATVISRLAEWRTVHPHIKALITTGSDELAGESGSNDRNRHARKIRAALKLANEQIAPRINLRVEIATSVTHDGEPDDNSITKIGAFRGDMDDIARVGHIDILIVKAMGVVGLDVPELKVQACLSTQREGPQALQERSRSLTALEGSNGRPSDLIMLHDVLNDAIMQVMRDAGGVAHEVSQSEVINEEEVPPPEASQDQWHLGGDTRIDGYANELGSSIIGDREVLLATIKARFHIGNLTDVEILENYEHGAYSGITQNDLDEQRQVHETLDRDKPAIAINLSKRTEQLQGRFGKEAKRYINHLINYGVNPSGWREQLALLQAKAKQRARVNVPIESIDDPDVLERCIVALREEYEILRSRYNQ